MKKRLVDSEIAQHIKEALLCKSWGCRPSQLNDELSDKVEIHSLIYHELYKVNPFAM